MPPRGQVEVVLYSNVESTGALYRLLKRTPGAEGRALSLRRRSSDLVTEAEWDGLVANLHSGVRMLTLLPRDTAVAAAVAFGHSPTTVALLAALGAAPPADWETDGESESERESGGESEDEGGGESEGESRHSRSIRAAALSQLRSAAVAMRHSSKTQASAAYSKGESAKLVAAAARVADEFAASFLPASA